MRLRTAWCEPDTSLGPHVSMPVLSTRNMPTTNMPPVVRPTSARLVAQPTATSSVEPPQPHYLLFSEASTDTDEATWRFVLQGVTTSRTFSASGNEPAACRERLELLAVVRGLESLDGAAKLTLVTKSRYVSRGLRRGLIQWRDSSWQWERFGKLRPIRDADLWRRVDRALKFHEVDCRLWQFVPEGMEPESNHAAEVPVKLPRRKQGVTRRADNRHGGLVGSAREKLRRAGRAAASLGQIAGGGLVAQ